MHDKRFLPNSGVYRRWREPSSVTLEGMHYERKMGIVRLEYGVLGSAKFRCEFYSASEYEIFEMVIVIVIFEIIIMVSFEIVIVAFEIMVRVEIS